MKSNVLQREWQRSSTTVVVGSDGSSFVAGTCSVLAFGVDVSVGVCSRSCCFSVSGLEGLVFHSYGPEYQSVFVLYRCQNHREDEEFINSIVSALFGYLF